MALAFKVTALSVKGVAMIDKIVAEKLGIKEKLAIGLERVDDKTLIYRIKLLPAKPELYSVALRGGYGQPALYSRFEKEYGTKNRKDFKIERHKERE